MVEVAKDISATTHFRGNVNISSGMVQEDSDDVGIVVAHGPNKPSKAFLSAAIITKQMHEHHYRILLSLRHLLHLHRYLASVAAGLLPPRNC